MLRDDDVGAAAHRIEPSPELFDVRDGRGEGDNSDVVGKVDNRLFPDGAAEPVGKVVHLVQDDVPEPLKGGRIGVEHIAQHLGGHHKDRGLGVNARIPGK